VTAVAPHTAPPSSLIHLTKAKRVVIRSVDDIAIAGEKRIAQLKHELAVSHGTATSAFTHEGMTAAYLPDPSASSTTSLHHLPSSRSVATVAAKLGTEEVGEGVCSPVGHGSEG
jgi:hypothetical protein